MTDVTVTDDEKLIHHFVKHGDQGCSDCKRGMEIYVARKAGR